ncbi:hypothetical protein GCM10023215_34230 [Pseudonocardia yuanmonensis]|uniref:Uncharacterized protein n=1 Tax=Pseudonocardia yuanmonensis TaxID=1095914 RepID=A0ABP8WQI6_9PSEU
MSHVGRAFGKDDKGRQAAAQAAYEISCAAQSKRAARVVAGMAVDAEDCAELLAMLGLDGQRPTTA